MMEDQKVELEEQKTDLEQQLCDNSQLLWGLGNHISGERIQDVVKLSVEMTSGGKI